MLNRFIFLISLTAVVVLLVMMNLTTPAEVGPLGVLVFFTTVYIVMIGVMVGIVGVFRKIAGKKGGMQRKDYAYALALALGPIMLLLAHSIGTAWWLSLGGVVIAVALICFVISKKV